MSNVINFTPKRTEDWASKFASMDKLDLLSRMVSFQERRPDFHEALPTAYVAEGLALFSELERQAETAELRTLSRNYRDFFERQRNRA